MNISTRPCTTITYVALHIHSLHVIFWLTIHMFTTHLILHFLYSYMLFYASLYAFMLKAFLYSYMFFYASLYAFMPFFIPTCFSMPHFMPSCLSLFLHAFLFLTLCLHAILNLSFCLYAILRLLIFFTFWLLSRQYLVPLRLLCGLALSLWGHRQGCSQRGNSAFSNVWLHEKYIRNIYTLWSINVTNEWISTFVSQ
jgi:hypothetical protein